MSVCGSFPPIRVDNSLDLAGANSMGEPASKIKKLTLYYKKLSELEYEITKLKKSIERIVNDNCRQNS